MSETRNSILEFSILPVGGADSLSEPVARCTRIVRDSGLNNQLHSMGTILEGDLDQSLGVVKKCLNEVLKDSPRASVSIRIDARADGETGIDQRVMSVEEKV